MTCTECHTTKSPRWTGVRTGRVVCWNCRMRAYQRERAKSKRVDAVDILGTVSVALEGNERRGSRYRDGEFGA